MEQTVNHAEFLRLYNTYYKAVYYTSLGILHQPDAAAACMQDTFAALWDPLRKEECIRNPGAWLMTVARHSSMGVLRRQRYLAPLDEVGELPSPDDDTSRLPEEDLFIAHLLKICHRPNGRFSSSTFWAVCVSPPSPPPWISRPRRCAGGSPPPANCSSRNSKTWTGWKNGKWALHESPDLYQPSSMSY